LGIRVGLSILSILVIIVIGFSISPAYAGPPMTDVWAFYGEVGGSKIDATTTGNAPLSDSAGILGDGTKFLVGHIENYQNVASANTIPFATLKGPQIQAKCFGDATNPVSDLVNTPPQFGWDFTTLTTLNCVQNQRADVDLGLGVDLPVTALAPEDEVEVGEIVVLDLSALLNDYENFMFRLSSNSQGETGWAGVSDTPPTGPVDETDFQAPTGSLLGTDGLFPGDDTQGNNFNDVYISFTPKKFLYYTQTEANSDNLLQQIKADVSVIGGTGIQLDTTSILLAGAQTNAFWILPMIVLATIIGIITIRRK